MGSKIAAPTEAYLERAKQLSADEADRLMARMRGRFSRRFADQRLTALQAIALQLEFEDDELAQWRNRMNELRDCFDTKSTFPGQRAASIGGTSSLN